MGAPVFRQDPHLARKILHPKHFCLYMEYHGIWFCNLPMFEATFYHLIRNRWVLLGFSPRMFDPPHQGATSTLGWPMAARHAANSYGAGVMVCPTGGYKTKHFLSWDLAASMGPQQDHMDH